MRQIHFEVTKFSRFFFSNEKLSILWLLIRLYVGWEWLMAGWDKLVVPQTGGMNPVWFGSNAGGQLGGFIQGALHKTTGLHPDVPMWYASFLQHVILPHTTLWANVVAFGELFVGIALIVGVFVGVAAFFGAFMNFNYLLAGTVSINPMLFLLGILLILAWRVAGYLGLDYFVLPNLSKALGQKKKK